MSAHNSEFEVPSLLFLAFKSLAANLHKVVSLQGIPEDIVCALFENCLSESRLTEGFLDMFVETKHAKLLARIQALKLRPIPPVLPLTRNGWLGDSPSWM
mmetsp:Transcript_13591/g.26113  ORF Transcript_13591/g.26113 Transcript_13591/m.26113 type:complete len:100 (-) Transcript_13591:138-437(-)